MASLALLAAPQPALAQSITLDGTLGTNAAIPTFSTPAYATVYDIEQNLGQTVGSNLFHSFGKFNLTATEAAFFRSIPEIRNIFARVTGGAASSIDGLIATQANRDVNLFLINPSGILFGPNARLNIGSSTRGSFVATTLDAITFPNGSQFSATNPGNANSLLTIVGDPSGFLASQRTPAAISVRGSALGVYPGQSLLLLGGNVTLDDASLGFFRLQGQGGRIELAGISGAGTVDLNTNQNDWRLTIPSNVSRADVAITNGSRLDVATIGGNLSIFAQNLDISGDSTLVAGVSLGERAFINSAGDITLNVTETLSIRQESFVGNFIDSEGIGNGGDIRITAGSLLITEGSQLGTIILGIGNAGNLQIQVRDRILIDGESPEGLRSGIFSEVSPSGKGDSGNILIDTGSLQISNGAGIAGATFGFGNGGDILIRATNQIVLDDGFINTSTSVSGRGNSGNIRIEAGSLQISNGARISGAIFGDGNGGDILINANNQVVLDDGFITTLTNLTGRGNSGDIRIAATSLEARDGSQIISAAAGFGENGNITIFAADHILLDDSAVFSEISSTAAGNGGNIFIASGNTLQLRNGSQLGAVTLGSGNGGNIRLIVDDAIILEGINSSSGFQTRINTSTTTDGRGGNISVDTQALRIIDNAEFNAVTSSRGSGGNISIHVRTLDLLNGGQLNTETQASGQTGKINIDATDRILISGVGFNNQPSALKVQFTASSAAGEIELNTRNLTLDNQGQIFSFAPSGNGGNLTLNVQDLFLMRRGSQISVSAGTAQAPGNGGNITINAPRGFLVTAPNENNDITANAFNGSGGRVNITAQGIYWFTPRSRAELARLLGTSDPSKLDPRLLPTNDITAISQGNPNLSGTVSINTLGVDPSRGLVALPAVLVDPSQQIVQTCVAEGPQRSSSFVITGRGGIPMSPDELLESRVVLPRWVELPETTEQSTGNSPQKFGLSQQASQTRSQAEGDRDPATPIPIQPSSQPSTRIVEATGWVVDPDGTVRLVAEMPAIAANPLFLPLPCH